MQPWHTRSHDPWGRAIDPAALPTNAERICEVRRVCGRMLADRDPGARWLAAALLGWVAGGRDLIDALGLRPARGSRRTVARIGLQAERDHALLALAVAVGCDARALRILRGTTPCPPEHRDLLEAARAARAPTGDNAITRARRRVTTYAA